MNKDKVLVLGCLGYFNNQVDGQTIKTRNIYQLFSDKKAGCFGAVSYFDTLSFRINKLRVFLLIKQILKCEILIYLPAHNNLKYLLPIIFFIAKVKNIKIHYIVIGGWLDVFLEDKPLHRFLLKRVNCIYPENEKLRQSLMGNYDFKNVQLLPNYRLHDYKAKINEVGPVVKLVFLARVDPMKGVNCIFKLAKELNQKRYENFSIDLYGPINASYKESFFAQEANFPSVNYKGIVSPENIHDILNEYDLMLFPTQYYTEGFPGSILDAYIAGIPVIATEWKHAHEFIENNKTGVITEFGNDDDFIKNAILLLTHPDRIYMMKALALNKSKEYSGDIVWDILKSKLFNS
jgi:glycosyltransferase involved in cell wall biosynthesis